MVASTRILSRSSWLFVAVYAVLLHAVVAVVLWKSDFLEIVAKNLPFIQSATLATYAGVGPAPVSNDRIAVQTIELDLPVAVIDDGAGGLIAVDADGDGRRDLVVTKPGHIAVYDLSGRKLWTRRIDIQVTRSWTSDGLPGLHGPGVQAADIDGDGATEILFLTRDNVLHVVAGATGADKHRVALPPPPAGAAHWEHVVVANFRGVGERDLLLQASNVAGYRVGRFLAAYAADALLADAAAAPLWTRQNFLPAIHSGARVADLDGDGRDEVLGAMLLGPDGGILTVLPVAGHIDSIFVADVRPDLPGREAIALEEGGGNRVFLYNHTGLIWEVDHRGWEPQNAALGEFDETRPGLEVWNRSRFNQHQRPFVFDAQGRLVTQYEMREVAPAGWTVRGVEVIFPIHWTGGARQLAAAKERHKAGDIAIFDPISGAFVHRIEETADRLYVADVAGDWREELIVLSGNQIRIYSNTAPNPNPDRASLWTDRDYRLGKMTWNYYNP